MMKIYKIYLKMLTEQLHDTLVKKQKTESRTQNCLPQSKNLSKNRTGRIAQQKTTLAQFELKYEDLKWMQHYEQQSKNRDTKTI